MELFIPLLFFVIIAISLHVFFYKRKQKQKIDLEEKFQFLIHYIENGMVDESLHCIQKILYNPFLGLQKLKYIKKYLNSISEKECDINFVEELKRRILDKENSYNSRYYGPDGTQ